MKWKITFSKKFSLECRGKQASISLERKSRLASCVILALGTLVTSVLKKKQNNEIRKERWRDWMKEETKYRMIECTRICTNINYCFLSYSKAIISKNRFVTHLRTTIMKLASVVKSLSYFRCVTSYVTNMNWFIIFRSFFEVKTDTVVVQIAH